MTSSAAKKPARSSASKKFRPRSGAWTFLVPAVLVALAIVATTAVVVSREQAEREDAAQIFAEDAGEVKGLTFYEDLSRNHVEEDVDYEQTPPAGGNHSPVWLNCGAYGSEVPEELAVHSLEHGAVWLAHQPDASDEDVEALTEIAEGNGYVLVSPVAELASPVVATAWGAQLELDDVEDPKLEGFVTQFAQGPQTPEPGAPCTGGVTP